MTTDDPIGSLYNSYHRDLVRYAFSIVHDMEEAEDVVQETFVRYWKRSRESGTADNEKSFLISMVHNRSLDRLRRRNAARHVAIDDPAILSILYNEPSESVFDKICSEEISSIVKEEIMKLPPKCAEIFKMCRYTPMTYEEVARSLGLSVSTVKTQMIIAMKRLYSKLKDVL